jgi:hypothetical protein
VTKKRVSKNIQTSTLKTMPMTPPKEGGRMVPREFIPYDGTKEEEVEALKLVFWIDGSNPYKDDAYNINRFKPLLRYEELDYQTYVLNLHSEMEVLNKYIAIQDLMKHMFSTSHVWVPPAKNESADQYMYSHPLHEYLCRWETPEATRRRTGNETPPRSIKGSEGQEEEFDFSEDKEDTESEDWKTIKRIKDRERRMTTREKRKQQLTKVIPTKSRKQEEMSRLFESEDEELEAEIDTVRKQGTKGWENRKTKNKR